MRALVLIALVGCSQLGTAYDAASGEGTVYECRGEKTVELCFYDEAAAELADRLGEGWSCSGTSRWWPQIANAIGAGCSYYCPSHVGCNAKNGCACFGGGE